MFLFFDTETTGLPQRWNAPVTDVDNWPRLVQLAWIMCDDKGNIIEERSDIIKPEGFSIPVEASLISYAKDYAKGRSVKEDSLLLVIDECQLMFNARDWNA